MGVKPEFFAKSMRDYWSSQHGLKSNSALEEAWHQMAITFNNCIEGKVYEDSDTDWVFPSEQVSEKESQWSVLCMPTGTGKTEGLSLYCSLLSEQENHPGVLIVTKFTKEIDRIVENINRHPFKKTALADYGDMKARPSSMQINASPVLAITHSAYQLSLDAQSQDEVQSSWWRKYTEWNDGSRKLVIIDESLDVVETISVGLDKLRILRAWVPRVIEKSYQGKIKAYDDLIEHFYSWEKENLSEYNREEILPIYWKSINQDDLLWLRDELCKLPLSEIVVGRSGLQSVKRQCQKVFAEILTILNSRSWCETRGTMPFLRTSYVSLPTHIKNAVVMDATGNQSKIYDLLGSLPHFPKIAKGIRNYTNVHLNLVYGCQNSETYLSKQNEKHFIDILNGLTPNIRRDKKFLLITFSSVEKIKLAAVKKEYRNCRVAHWGDINGKNDWHDLDTVILYGLPRLGTLSVESAILAFENWHTKTKLHVAPIAHLEEMPDGSLVECAFDVSVSNEEYHAGHVITNVIQAINRICCRKVIDENGNCPSASVYLLLDDGVGLEEKLLQGIRAEMQGINENKFDISLPYTSSRLAATGRKIVDFLSKKSAGNYLLKDLCEELSIKKDTMEKYVRQYKEKDSLFGISMRGIGIIQVTDARGRNQNPQAFIKENVN